MNVTIDLETVRGGEKVFVLRTQKFDWHFVAAVKKLAELHKHGKGWYKDENNAWKLKTSAWDALRSAFPGASYTQAVLGELITLAAQAEAAQAEKRQLRDKLIAALPDYTQVRFGGDQMKTYQVEAIHKLIHRSLDIPIAPGSGFIFDDLGLGKTYTSLAIARLFQDAIGTKTHVVTKRILFGQWQEVANKFGVPITLHSLHHSQIPEPFDEDYFLIVDEAHFCRGIKATTKKKDSSVGAKYSALAQGAKGFVPLTASPTPAGKCRELFRHFEALKHPVGLNKSHFQKYYCEAHFDSYGWSLEGGPAQEARLKELRALMEPFTVARTREQMADIPPETYVPIWIEQTKQTEREFQALLKGYVANSTSESLKWVIEHEYLSAEQIDGWVRQAGAMVKLAATIELAETLLDGGHAIIASFEFVEPAKLFAAKLGCPLLIGETSAKERERFIRKFQDEGGAIAMTTQTGGTGLNLQRASAIIQNSMSWVYENNRQLVGRAVRTGQDKKVVVYRMLYGPHESRMLEVLLEAEGGISEVIPIRKVMSESLGVIADGI